MAKYINISMGLFILIISGCATVHEMGVKKADQKVNLNNQGMVLMSIEVDNQYKPDYQPQIMVVNIETPDAESKKDRHNFKTDMEGIITSSHGTRYLMRMKLQPGEYIARAALCQYYALFLMATCQIPIHGEFKVNAGEITYLGRVSATMRERHGDEFRAGPVIPLIDQAVTGFSSSTFDVVISDQQKEDLRAFTENFSALKSEDIKISILPEFDRQQAQLWWESNGSKGKRRIKEGASR